MLRPPLPLVDFEAGGALKHWNFSGGLCRLGISGSTERSALRYYFSDHLGSLRAVATSAGTVVEARDYYAFGLEMPGRTWMPSLKTREGYTGHELDAETGFNYAGARYYNPGLARWMVVDPLAGDFPGHSPYNYVMGNPIRLVDPDGRAPDCPGCNPAQRVRATGEAMLDRAVGMLNPRNWFGGSNQPRPSASLAGASSGPTGPEPWSGTATARQETVSSDPLVPLAASTVVTSEYSNGANRTVETNNGVQSRPHGGVDFAAAVGTPVIAPIDGTVIDVRGSATSTSGLGLNIRLNHGSLRSTYAHLSRSVAVPGIFVSRGDTIGFTGNSGNSSGPHLHFEVRLNSTGQTVAPTRLVPVIEFLPRR